jgi:hypothetical protein
MKNRGLSVIIRNKEEFDKIKEFLGEEVLYLDFVHQMAIEETAIIINCNIDSVLGIFSVGGAGLAKIHQRYKIRTVEFKDFFKI